MLNSSGNSASEVDLRLNCSTCLTHLVGVINPACVYSSTGRTYYSANLVSELLDQFKSGSVAQTTSAGADDLSVSQGYHFLHGLNDVLDFDSDVFFSNYRLNVYNFALSSYCSFLFLHNAGTNG